MKDNNKYIFFIPINKKLINKLIDTGILNKENNNNNNIEARIISKDTKNIKIGFGIFSMLIPSYKDPNTRIKWMSNTENNIPENIYTHPAHSILDFDINTLNKDFSIKKRIPIYPSVNDEIILKINYTFINDKSTPDYIKKIITLLKEYKDEGLECKILTYNLWDPPSSIEILDEENACKGFKKNISGSLILGSGKWTKYKIPFNKNNNTYELLSHNLFPIDNLDKKNINNNYIFYINNKDLFYFNFYILK